MIAINNNRHQKYSSYQQFSTIYNNYIRETAINLHIFDMDGTILDSMDMWSHLGSSYLSKLLSQPDYQGIDPSICKNIDQIISTMTLDQSADYFVSFGINKTKSDIVTDIIQLISEQYRYNIPVKPGMKSLLQCIKQTKTKICILTTSERSCVISAFERLGIIDVFDHVYTCTEIGTDKTNPDTFLNICDIYNTKPSHTMVYEDSLYAIKTAYNAGCNIASVYDQVSDNDWSAICSMSDWIFQP